MGALGEPPIELRLWDAEPAWQPPGEPVATVRFGDRAALWRFLARPELGFAAGYEAGSIAVEGELPDLLGAVFRPPRPRQRWTRLATRRLLPRRANRRKRARKNAQHHYDLGNDFYAMWLDEHMVYTCAYFEDAAASLEQAQLAKLDLVCRKAGLRPGQRVLELGSGWGSLAIHAALRYGVEVRAFNVSREQVAYARERARALGLGGRVEFVEGDYRNALGRYDAVVSVGMLEHVGLEHYPELRRVIDRTLAARGRGLLHFIGRAKPRPLNAWMERAVFPGAHPPSLVQMLAILEPIDMAVIDVENLRPHYALTLRHWFERFSAHAEEIEALVGAERARAFHLYLAGTLAAFEAGSCQLFQVLFTRASNTSLALTREELYAGLVPEVLTPEGAARWIAATS